MAALCALQMGLSAPGQTYSVSRLAPGLAASTAMAPSTVAAAYSAATLCSGLLQGRLGAAADALGARAATLRVASGLACACLLAAATPTRPTSAALPVAFVAFLLLRLCGQGGMTLLSKATVSRWFRRRRGCAVALASLGGTLGGASAPPIDVLVARAHGWRAAFALWAGLVAAFVPCHYFLLKAGRCRLNPAHPPPPRLIG